MVGRTTCKEKVISEHGNHIPSLRCMQQQHLSDPAVLRYKGYLMGLSSLFSPRRRAAPFEPFHGGRRGASGLRIGVRFAARPAS